MKGRGREKGKRKTKSGRKRGVTGCASGKILPLVQIYMHRKVVAIEVSPAARCRVTGSHARFLARVCTSPPFTDVAAASPLISRRHIRKENREKPSIGREIGAMLPERGSRN